jgi:NAD-dependent dihydropyrimidine dehydrogenase PreA subunit/putative sterol carrier protein
MPDMNQHPTVLNFRQQNNGHPTARPAPLDSQWLREQVLAAGADDVGFVSVDDPAIAEQREEIRLAFPACRTLIAFVCRMNREPVRSPARSVANLEFHHASDHTNEVAREVVRLLEDRGIRALNPSVGFPMEAQNFPDKKTWVVSFKPIVVAAGLGQMGIHRNVIHPRFGNFILLGVILTDAEVSEHNQPIDYNPCLECKLCVAACPVGAISPDGAFNFSSCFTHNYREFMGGFNDWVEALTDSKDNNEYREQFNKGETTSMWQSLSFGANYKAAYCMAVCPAGEDVIGPFLTDRKGFLQEVVKPLQDKVEPVYVLPGSDAEAHVAKRFPHKKIRRVKGGLSVETIDGFIRNARVAFRAKQAEGLNAVYHFVFTGEEPTEATLIIRDQQLTILQGLQEKADLVVTVDSTTWLGILAKRQSAPMALLRRKLKVKGSPRLLLSFQKCFAT